MHVLFCAGFGPIVSNPEASLSFYRDALGLPLEAGDYPATGAIDGIKHFGLWRLEDAAASCFGTTAWPVDVPVPQGNIEFDVDDVAKAAAELEARGCVILTGPKAEPWGQEVARLLSPEGLLVGVTRTG